MSEVQSSIAIGVAHRLEVQPGERRILVVDDEVYIVSLVSEMISRELRERPVQVHSAEDAIEELERGEFDLVISDIRMPGIGGFGLLDWIQKNRPALKQHFLFITGHAGGAGAEGMLAKLGVPVMRKPFSYADLIQRCQDLLGERTPAEVECQGHCCLEA